MNTNSKTSPLGLCFLSTFLYRSFYVIGLFNIIISISKSDSLFSVIIGSIIGFVFLFIYFYLNNHLEENNIFEKINKTFPKVISDLFIVILIISFMIISSYNLYNLALFINYNLLNDISIIPISILLLLCITYLSIKGINTVIRTSGILIFIWIFLVIISFLALVNYSNPSNLYPFLVNNPLNIFKGGIYYGVISITPLLMLLLIPKNKIENNKRYQKYMLITYIINALYFIINLVLILSILGYKFTNILKYPDIIILQKVSLLNFIERIEDLLSFKLMFDGFIFLSLAIIYIKEGLINVLKIKSNNKIIYFISIAIIICSLYLHLTNIEFTIPFMISILIIHFFLLIFIKIKNFTNNSQ